MHRMNRIAFGVAGVLNVQLRKARKTRKFLLCMCDFVVNGIAD